MIELENLLPEKTEQALADLSELCESVDASFLVVGATARDLVLVYGYGAKIERATQDVDFGVSVSSWDHYDRLKEALTGAGYQPDPAEAQRFSSGILELDIDVVPFGGIETDISTISWPPEESFRMVVLGFQEALDSALRVKIRSNPDLFVPVASPEGVCLLKLVAWIDREADEKRLKDALDLKFLIETYAKIPAVFESLYDEGYMEAQDFDEEKASAMKLGKEVAKISSAETKAFLMVNLFDEEALTEKLARQMTSNHGGNAELALEWITIFKASF